MPIVQEENTTNHCQGDRSIATRHGNDTVQLMRVNDRCASWDIKCQSMSLNARCAKSVWRWIEVSMKKTNQSAAEQT